MGFDEKALRRPEWAEGRWITLADGQAWSFPEPSVSFFPKLEGGKVEMGHRITFGPEADAEIDAIFNPETDPFASLTAQVTLAARLLLTNYDLASDHLSSLLVKDAKDPANGEMWAELLGLMVGAGPKPSPDGSESAS